MFALSMVGRAEAILFQATGDPQHNSATPGDNSGWQYEGKFLYFLGVPIAPHFFITAKHFGGTVGAVFDFHGDAYTTIAFQDVGTTDLRIWEVNHAKPFPTYAPLSSGAADTGATATILGRGTQRGNEVLVGGVSKGWKWGPSDDVERWGRNTVTGILTFAPLGQFLYCDFDKPGIPDECSLSTGDSGGGMFVLENGLWRLAGINYGVDSPFRTGPGGAAFYAALFDAGGLQYQNDDGSWTSIADLEADIPTSLYCSRIAGSLAAITAIAPEAAGLASENFNAWQRLYFTPAQIAALATSGPLGDFDKDGIGNLLEFALNLDPTFNENAAMVSNTGLRGLPIMRVESVAGADHLTLEFVRRTAGSGAGLTYTPEFSSDLGTWAAVGTASVTTINPRWERVKIVDTLTTSTAVKRFGRVKVALAD